MNKPERCVPRRDGVDSDGDTVWRCLHCCGWSGSRRSLLLNTCVQSSKKFRLGDRVCYRGDISRIGKIWELRNSGRASVHWDDDKPAIHVGDANNYNVKHYKLENLRHAM